MDHIFPLLCMIDNLLLDRIQYEFCLDRDFYIPLILGSHSGILLHLMEIVLAFRGLLLSFVRQNQSNR